MLIQALLLIRCRVDRVTISTIGSCLHPYHEIFRRQLYYVKSIDEGFAEKGYPFMKIKKQLSYGVVPTKQYPASLALPFQQLTVPDLFNILK